MKVITPQQLEQLKSNGLPENREKDHYPVVKLFLSGTTCTWLLTEIDHEDESIAFGLCDLGMGFPELGYVSLQELDKIRLKGIFKVERNLFFEAKYPLSVYTAASRSAQCITEDEVILKRFAK